MQLLIIYLIGYVLAFIALRKLISKFGTKLAKNDLLFCFVLSLPSYIMLFIILLIFIDHWLEKQFKQDDIPSTNSIDDTAIFSDHNP